MTEKKKYIAQKEKNELRLKLYKRDGSNCHYCGIEEEDFFRIWGKFYGGKRIKLEVDRKDNKKGYNEENCVLTCVPSVIMLKAINLPMRSLKR